MLRCPAISVLSFLHFVVLLVQRKKAPAITFIAASVIFHCAAASLEKESLKESLKSTAAVLHFSQPSLRVLVLLEEENRSDTNSHSRSISRLLDEAVIKWNHQHIPSSRTSSSKPSSPWYSFASTRNNNEDIQVPTDLYVRNISLTKLTVARSESPSSVLKSLCESIEESQAILLLSFVSRDVSFLASSCAAAASLPLLSIQHQQQDSSSVFLQVSDFASQESVRQGLFSPWKDFAWWFQQYLE